MSTLRELESYGLIRREQFHEIPPHVEYSFTQKGRDLFPIFYEMMNWGFQYEADNEKIMQEQVENGKAKDPR